MLTLLVLPAASLVLCAISGVALVRGHDELASLAALHTVAVSLANIACWFVL